MHNRQRHSPCCAPHRQRAKRQRQYRNHESLRPGAKQSAATVDCIDPRNIIPRPLRLLHPFVPFFLFVGRGHPLPSPRSSPTPASSRVHFLSNHRPHRRLPPPTPVASAPLRGPQKNRAALAFRISYLSLSSLAAGVATETD